MTGSAVQARVREVLTGRAASLTRPEVQSAIAKRPARAALAVGTLGLDGDEQADRALHGGPDKAVHLYAWSHYATWQRELPGCGALWRAPGAFGENLSVEGLDETGVCIGDRWRAGDVEIEVSQGRQPCWKLNLRFGVPDMARRVQDSLRAGWYARVVRPGTVSAGDAMELLHRPHAPWTVARLLALIRDRACDPALLDEVLELPLTPSWRRLFERRRTSGRTEDWAPRLQR